MASGLVLFAYVVVHLINHSLGIASVDAMEAMLREQLRKQAGDDLRSGWQNQPDEALTPEIEEMIVEEVRAVRSERHKRNAG